MSARSSDRDKVRERERAGEKPEQVPIKILSDRNDRTLNYKAPARRVLSTGEGGGTPGRHANHLKYSSQSIGRTTEGKHLNQASE